MDKDPAQERLIEKIRALPPEKVAAVEDFVDFLRQRDDDRRLTQAAAKLSEHGFHAVWDNDDDAAYDQP
jgi:predicted MPP superfamily phosphohydrolase